MICFLIVSKLLYLSQPQHNGLPSVRLKLIFFIEMLGRGVPHPRPDGAFLPAGLCLQQPQQPSGVPASPAVRTDGQMADLALRPPGRVVQQARNSVRIHEAQHLPGTDRLPEFLVRRDAARQRVELRKQKRPHGLKGSL